MNLHSAGNTILKQHQSKKSGNLSKSFMPQSRQLNFRAIPTIIK